MDDPCQVPTHFIKSDDFLSSLSPAAIINYMNYGGPISILKSTKLINRTPRPNASSA